MLGKVVLWYLGQGTAFTFVLGGGIEGLVLLLEMSPPFQCVEKLRPMNPESEPR